MADLTAAIAASFRAGAHQMPGPARVQEASDDHFYGAWKGGKASAGGHPAAAGAKVAEPDKPYAGTDFAAAPKDAWGDATKPAAWLEQNAQRYADDPQFAAASDALVHYTTGGYGAIRALTAGDVTEDSPLGAAWFDSGFKGHAFPDQIHPRFYSSTNDSRFTSMQAAQALGAYVDASPRRSAPIYRGVPEFRLATATEQLPLRDLPQPGQIMEVKGVSSFTRDPKVADGFGRMNIAGSKGFIPDRVWVYEVRNARGIDVDALSPWRQKEVVSRGRFRVVSVDRQQRLAKHDKDGNPVYTDQPWRQSYNRRSKDDEPGEVVRVVLEGID